MKILSAIATTGSGSLGGITLSRNKGGMYLRSRMTPTDPASSFQNVMRGFFGSLSDEWVNVLTSLQREAWDVYAINVSMLDALGQSIKLSGINHFIRSNALRNQIGAAQVDDAPTIFDLGEFDSPTVASIDPGAQTASINFDDTQAWVDEDDSHLAIYASRPQNNSINFFKGPYRFALKVDGNSTTAPSSPVTVPLPFAVAAGNRVFFQARVTRADGRLSGIRRFRGIAV